VQHSIVPVDEDAGGMVLVSEMLDRSVVSVRITVDRWIFLPRRFPGYRSRKSVPRLDRQRLGAGWRSRARGIDVGQLVALGLDLIVARLLHS
jgi:hypothetical protein